MADNTKRSPGYVTHLVVYVLAVTVMYFVSTPEITGKLSDRQQRDFHVAAFSPSTNVAYPVSLAQLNDGKVDLGSVSFLAPPGDITVSASGHDLHKVTVLERHPDWQLVEYHYGNSHDSKSRYRAFKARIEPVSYRVTMDIGLFLSAVILVVPAWIVAALINAVWNRAARMTKRSEPT